MTAGRPAGLDLQVSIPPGQHDELAVILIDAVLTCEPGETPGTRRCGPHPHPRRARPALSAS